MDPKTIHNNLLSLSAQWSTHRLERLNRKQLNSADFKLLANAGFTLTGVPKEMGGAWRSMAESTRITGEMLRTLASIDPSLALVSAMHPMVLSLWLEDIEISKINSSDWNKQRDRVLGLAREGHWYGTIASEPGAGGDIMETKSTASIDENQIWRLTGVKHMGSGSGITSFMMTVAVPEGEDKPEIFLLDTRELPWDGSKGATLVSEWDGHGMAATQSHAFKFSNMEVERHGLLGDCLELLPRVIPVMAYYFSAVTLGVLDAAISEAHLNLKPKAQHLTSFEKINWTKAANDIWLAEQAFEGMAKAIETEKNLVHVQRGKLAIAELAEASLLAISKAIGGKSFSRSNPFGQWSQDVRALGFLRPPWALAYETLFEDNLAE